MVQTNKILTVSYGTFSCTLEGFDDSFGTMKAIAEYFRDLASDDRYFGAEPPQPDAEMLARIAQREISRRVDARSDGSGILLRATAPEQDQPNHDQAATQTAEDVAHPAPQPAGAAPAVAPTSAAPTSADPTAQPAAPMQAPVAGQPVPQQPQYQQPQYQQTQYQQPVSQDPVSRPADNVTDAEDMPTPVPSAPMADTLADKLARIRAVVDRNDAASAASEDMTGTADPGIEQTPIETGHSHDTSVTGMNAALAGQYAQPFHDAYADAAPSPQDLGADLPMEAGDLALDPQSEEIYDANAEAIDPDEDTLDAIHAALGAEMADARDGTETFGASDVGSAPNDMAPNDKAAYDTAAADTGAYGTAGLESTDHEAAPDEPLRDETPDALTSAAFGMDAPVAPLAEDAPAPSAEMADVGQAPLALTPDHTASVDLEPETGPALPDQAQDEAFHAPSHDAADTEGAFEDEYEDDFATTAHDALVEDLAPLGAEATSVQPLSPAAPAEAADLADIDEANVFSSIDWDSDDTDTDEDDGTDPSGDDRAIQNILGELGPRNEAAVQAAASGPVTRVIKVKRASLEEAIATGALEDVDDAQQEAPRLPRSSLSATDEADLQAELDAVAAELAEAQAALNPPDEEAPISRGSHDRHRGSGVIERGEPDMNRLMAEADSKMGEPETSSRREAYTHLRAAVAAAEAEETLSPEDRATTDADAVYREDLASVVRPRRPESAGGTARPRRPALAERPAPLKLVAEQRVDADTVLPQRSPIRPRRVAAQQLAEPAGGTPGGTPGGFAAFAHEVGARELHELLEAAAAYMSFVEGWEQFSRPQLMTRVKQVSTSGFNREDGLRTFGQLLREGKIEKTSGGRFTASEQIGYRPAQQAG